MTYKHSASVRAAARVRNADYRSKHKAEIKAKNAAYYLANKEAINSACVVRARGGKYYNPISDKARQSNRRCRARANGGSFTTSEWLTVCALYGQKCLCCHKHKPLEPDHVIPVACGGSGSIENIQPLCRRCNARKGTKSVDYRPKSSRT